jgi:hypothetical protein
MISFVKENNYWKVNSWVVNCVSSLENAYLKISKLVIYIYIYIEIKKRYSTCFFQYLHGFFLSSLCERKKSISFCDLITIRCIHLTPSRFCFFFVLHKSSSYPTNHKTENKTHEHARKNNVYMPDSPRITTNSYHLHGFSKSISKSFLYSAFRVKSS